VKKTQRSRAEDHTRAALRSMFKRSFAHWGIEIPEDVEPRDRAGHIVEQGWAIWFRFGADDTGEFLDYYAAHRMTEDRHVRLRVSGGEESLAAIATMRLASEDPAEDARLHAEHLEANRRTEQLLREKGFGLTGAEPFSVVANRLLATDDDG
jgi:hypothetical protein